MRGDIRDFLKRVALAFGLVTLLLFLTNMPAILALRFPDPDDTLRLVQVRDLLAGQGWYDMVQHRVDPAQGGVAMHWSRLVDIPLAGVMLGLRPVLGEQGAEIAALMLVPLVTLALVLLLVARVAWERLGREATVLACLMVAMSVPLVSQIRPMRIDHHGWQIVAALLALQGVMTRHARAGGWISGAALAVGLSISLEALPLTALFGALGAWRWLRPMGNIGQARAALERSQGADALASLHLGEDSGETKFWLVHFAQALAAVSLACFAATRLGDMAQHCDAVSPVHLAMFVWAALALSALGLWRAAPWQALVAGFAVTGAGALAMYLGVAPQCRAGSFDMIDPLVHRLWYDQVAEGLPVWKQDWTTALQTVIPPLFGLGACVALIRRKVGDERVWWQEYTLLLAGALAIAMLVTRAGAVAGALAAVPLAWLVGEWLFALREGKTWDRRLAALAGIVLALVPSAPITLYGMVPQSSGSGGAQAGVAAGPQRVSSCDVRRHAGVLQGLPRGTILAPLDIGPELLLASPDAVLATGHHRGARAMHQVITAFTGSEAQLRGIIAENRIAYVALCPDISEPQIYAREAPQGLAARLLAGRSHGGGAPAWLVPVEDGPADGRLIVWRVVPPLR